MVPTSKTYRIPASSSLGYKHSNEAVLFRLQQPKRFAKAEVTKDIEYEVLTPPTEINLTIGLYAVLTDAIEPGPYCSNNSGFVAFQSRIRKGVRQQTSLDPVSGLISSRERTLEPSSRVSNALVPVRLDHIRLARSVECIHSRDCIERD